MKRNPADFGSGKEALMPSDLDGDAVVLTVEGTEEAEFDSDDGQGKRKRLILMFQETDKVVYLNVTMMREMIARYGEDDDEWKGKPVPLEVGTATFRNKETVKVRVATGERWDAILPPAKAKASGKGRAARA